MDSSALSVRSQMAAAKKRIGRLKRIDRVAVFVITMGGIAVVIAVLGILVFVAAEAMPLFTSAKLTSAGDVRAPIDLQPDRAEQMRAVGIDEYRVHLCGGADRPRGVPSIRVGRTRQRISCPWPGCGDRGLFIPH